MKFNKRLVIYMVISLLFIVLCTLIFTTTIVASNLYDFENFTEEDAISFVEEHNIETPQKIRDWEKFGIFTQQLIYQSYINPNVQFAFNSYEVREYAENIRLAVGKYISSKNVSMRSSNIYYLQYNTVMDADGNWVTSGGYYNPDWANYNCYAYALNRCEMSNFYSDVYSYEPGVMSTGNDILRGEYDVGELAQLVKDDLLAMGYYNVCIKETIPTVNDTDELICVRMMANIEYHFMRYDQETDAWYHKPGETAVLKYNTVPSNDALWWQEYSLNGEENYVYGAAYDSDIVFIRYSKNILNASGNSQGINILPNKDVFYEVNIDTSNHYRLRLIAGYEMDYELYNSDFDIVVSDSNTNNVDTCLSLTPGKYYLRINFTSSQSYSGLSASIGVGYDEHNCVNSSTHSSVCGGCGDMITKSHNFVCDGVENSSHYEKCADCGYRTIRMSDYQYVSINSTQHSKICTSCSYSITSSHNFVYRSTDEYHILTCSQCGKTSGGQQSHSWTTVNDGNLLIGKSVKCQTCGHRKILGLDEDIPIIKDKKDPEEETE